MATARCLCLLTTGAPPVQGNAVKWAGVLVKTGVYKDGDETNGACTTVHGVMEAVDWILKQEGH